VHVVVLDQAVWIILEEIVDCLAFTWIGSNQKINKAQNIPGNSRLGHDSTKDVVAGVLVITQTEGELLGVPSHAVDGRYFGDEGLNLEIEFIGKRLITVVNN
jgi:hypothetical protein